MLLDNDGAYPPLSRFFAQQLAFLEAGTDPAEIGLALAAEAGQGNEQRIVNGDNVSPPVWMYKAGGYAVVFCGGTEELSQAAYLVSAWSLRVPNDTIAGLPLLFDQLAFRFRAIYNAFGPPSPPRLFFVGHSYGGCIAQACAAYFKSVQPEIAILSVSFGAPRVGDARFARLQSVNSNTRWMNDDDPVPLLPPSAPAAVSYAAGLGSEVLYRWEAFQHGGGGIVLDDLGNPTPGELPPRGVVPGGASLAAWVLKTAQGGVTQHSMSAYYDRLTMLVNRTVPPSPVRPSAAPVEPSRITDRHTRNAQQDAFIQTIVHTGATQQQGPLIVPPDRPFKTVKFDGLWWVTFGGQLVAVGATRKRAGRMAVLGNDFLRRIQRQAGVDTVSLKQLFGEYLDAASTPDNGFSPVIAAFPTT